MNGILRGLPYAYVNIDNILITSRTVEEHLIHLWTVFERLMENGLIIRLEKCLVGNRELPFLRHLVDPDRILYLKKLLLCGSFLTPIPSSSCHNF